MLYAFIKFPYLYYVTLMIDVFSLQVKGKDILDKIISLMYVNLLEPSPPILFGFHKLFKLIGVK